MNEKKREANFELLRIIAIIMVIILHYLSHAEVLPRIGVRATAVNVTASLLESFCIVAVNVWVLISGYFLSKSGFKVKRLVQLIAEVFFYTIIISLAMQLVNVYRIKSDDTIFKTVQYCFPISSEHYWFATSYVLMYVLSPVLNKGVEFLSRLQLKVTILGLLFWFCFVKSFIPVNFPTDDYGYGLKWFICLYLIAAYIRKYDVTIVSDVKKSLFMYILSVLAIFAMTLGIHYINLKSGRLNYYFSVTAHYNFILCLTGALGIFSFFRYIRIKEGAFANLCRFLAPFTFGIYLFHEHLEIRSRWVYWMESLFGKISRTNIGLFLVHLLLSCILIFAAGVFIDWIRCMIFSYIGRVMGETKLFKAIERLDARLSAEGKDK